MDVARLQTREMRDLSSAKFTKRTDRMLFWIGRRGRYSSVLRLSIIQVEDLAMVDVH